MADDVQFPRFVPRQLPRGPFGFQYDPATGAHYVPESELAHLPADPPPMTLAETMEHCAALETLTDRGRSTEDRLDALRRYRQRDPLHPDDVQFLISMIMEGRGR